MASRSMKNDLQFRFEWEDPQAAKGAELRATWARLEVYVGAEPVTRLIDEKNGVVRTAVYGPLYPVAEWIAMNWWTLLHEVESPGTTRWFSHARRHSLASAGEGFALPDLRILPIGRMVELVWCRRANPKAGLTFVNSGTLSVSTESVGEALSNFVSRVVARLDSENIAGTPLQEEWDAIQLINPDERAFCLAAAALGEDPFAIEREARDEVLRSASVIPRELFGEFISATELLRLRESTNSLEAILDQVATSPHSLPSLAVLRKQLISDSCAATPWEEGYKSARALRGFVGLNGHLLADDASLAKALSTDEASFSRAVLAPRMSIWGVDAVVGSASDSNPVFVTAKSRGDSRRFALCRALYESIKGAEAALISRARSDRQQANRAFAAELLAPAELLRNRITHDRIEDEQIGDLAEEFGVSSKVIEHQIENHQLAKLVR